MKKYNEPTSLIPCSECSVGQMHKTKVTYFTWMGDELITVPDFPAWVCDICGRREYDTQALSQLSLLLNPNAGKSTLRKPAHQPRKSDGKRKGTQPSTSD